MLRSDLTDSSTFSSQEASGKFVLHTVQLLPQLVVRTLEHQKMFTLQDNGEFTYGISVRGRARDDFFIQS